jgi:hypothetical protein
MAGFNPSVTQWALTSGITALTTTTSTTLKAASATVRHFVTGIQLFNSVTNATNVVSILDGTTQVWTGVLQASSASLPVIDTIIGSGNTALNIQCGTAGSVYWNVQGFDAP